MLARGIDPLNRSVVARSDSLNTIINANAANIGQALFATYGTALPPDATFTLRISDGVVKSYPQAGTIAPLQDDVLRPLRARSRVRLQVPVSLPQRGPLGRIG